MARRVARRDSIRRPGGSSLLEPGLPREVRVADDAMPHVGLEVDLRLPSIAPPSSALTWKHCVDMSIHMSNTRSMRGIVEASLQTAAVALAPAATPAPANPHVWAGKERREGHAVDRPTAKVEDERLVYEFSVPVSPSAEPRGRSRGGQSPGPRKRGGLSLRGDGFPACRRRGEGGLQVSNRARPRGAVRTTPGP